MILWHTKEAERGREREQEREGERERGEHGSRSFVRDKAIHCVTLSATVSVSVRIIRCGFAVVSASARTLNFQIPSGVKCGHRDT